MLWSLPMLAAGLLALLRYGFGSLFVVGESVASALLQSSGADIAGTLQRMHTDPLQGAAEAAAGLVASGAAASLARTTPWAACALAALSGLGAWWFGLPIAVATLAAAAGCALLAAVTTPARP